MLQCLFFTSLFCIIKWTFHEIAQKVGMDHKTLARYIDLLEKAFVIVRLGGLKNSDIMKSCEVIHPDNYQKFIL